MGNFFGGKEDVQAVKLDVAKLLQHVEDFAQRAGGVGGRRHLLWRDVLDDDPELEEDDGEVARVAGVGAVRQIRAKELGLLP